MVSALGGADPASCSRLGGALRSGAARLAARSLDLDGVGPTAAVARDLVARLDAMGAVLQAHAQELAEIGAAAERLVGRVGAQGLSLDGWRVVEPYGVTDAAAAQRRRASAPELQAVADRLASRVGWARAQVERAAADGTTALAAVSRTMDEG